MSRTTCQPRAGRRGMALLMVLAALTLLGALVALSGAAVLGAQRSARSTVASNAVLAAAEGARSTALVRWHQRVPGNLAVGASVQWDGDSWNGADSRIAVSRLAEGVYRVEARASLGIPGPGMVTARRATSSLWMVEAARLPLRGALTAGAPILAAPTAPTTLHIDGRDSIPAGWRCTPADTASLAALATWAPVVIPTASLTGGSVIDSGSAAAGRYELTWPPPDTLRVAAPLTFAGDLTSPPVTPRDDGTGNCLIGPSEPLNWGDPRRPSACASWLPVVHVRGNLDAPSGSGQGVLIVDGELTLRGNFSYAGVVIVRGRLEAYGAGNRVVGALLARGGSGAPHQLDSLELRYSSCVVRAALRAAGVLRPVPDRGWAEWW